MNKLSINVPPRHRTSMFARGRVDLAVLTLGLAALALLCSACGEPQQQNTKEQVLLQRIGANPNDVNARLALANHYYDQGLTRLAIPSYVEVLRHRPDDPNIRTDLGTCYKRLGDLARARVAYETALKTHPKHTQALFNLGIVAEALGDHKAAAEAWEKAATTTQDEGIVQAAMQNAAGARATLETQGAAPARAPGGK